MSPRAGPGRAHRAGALPLASLLLLATAGAAAEAPAVAPIVPDRPSVSNGAATVPPGAVQIEAGVEYARTSLGGQRDERRLASQATLRVGLTERLELGVESEPVVRLRGPEDETGAGDVTLTGKYRFLDAAEGSPLPSLGVKPFVKLAVADEPIGSGRPDFGGSLLASLALPWDLGLDVNAGVAAIGQARRGHYHAQATASAALSHGLTEALSVFVEVFFASRQERGGREQAGVDGGATYLLTPRIALDLAVEAGLVGDGADYAIRAGMSARFGR